MKGAVASHRYTKTTKWRSVETHVHAGWKQSLHFRFCRVGFVAVACSQRLPCASSPRIARRLTSTRPNEDEIPSKHEHRNDALKQQTVIGERRLSRPGIAKRKRACGWWTGPSAPLKPSNLYDARDSQSQLSDIFVKANRTHHLFLLEVKRGLEKLLWVARSSQILHELKHQSFTDLLFLENVYRIHILRGNTLSTQMPSWHFWHCRVIRKCNFTELANQQNTTKSGCKRERLSRRYAIALKRCGTVKELVPQIYLFISFKEAI